MEVGGRGSLRSSIWGQKVGGKKETAGACRGCGESMDFQSQPADTEQAITLPDKADEAILAGSWPRYMAQPGTRRAGGFVLADHPGGTIQRSAGGLTRGSD